MGFNEGAPILPDDSYRRHVDRADRRGGVSEGGLALGELEPEVVDVLGPRLDPPRGEGVGGQPRLEPVGEGLRGGEAAMEGLGARLGHGGDLEEPAGVQGASEKWDL